MAKTDDQLFNSDQDLHKLLEQLLAQGPRQHDINSPPDVGGDSKPGWGDLAGDFAVGGWYNPKLYTDAFDKAFGSDHSAQIKAQQAYERAVGDANARNRKQYAEQIAAVKRAIARRGMVDRVNANFNSPQLQGVYDEIEKTLLDNSLAGVTQQYSDLLKGQSFQTAGQGLTGSSVHAERLGDLQQAQNAATIQAQNQARGYTNQIRNANEQQRQRLVQTVSQQNPAQAQQFNSQIDAIVNQTRQLGQQYANQATGQQIGQYGQQLQSQAIGGLLSGAGNTYAGYQQGYNNTMFQNQQNSLLQSLYGRG